MGRHIRPGSFPAYSATAQAGDLPFRPDRNERDPRAGSNPTVQDLLALSRPTPEQRRHARSMVQDFGYPRPNDEQWPGRQPGKFPASCRHEMATDSSQEEAIPESLKNVILLMANGGYLVPPAQDPSKEEFWSETKKRLDRFLPDLFPEIFPDASKQPVPAVTPAAPPSSSSPNDNNASGENPPEQSSSKESEAVSSPNPASGPGDGDAEQAQPQAS